MKKLLLSFLFFIIILIPTFSEASVWVNGYSRKDGTYVQGHYRSNPDGNPYNNWSYPGNTNPYTGEVAPGNPDTYLKNYYGDSSTYNIDALNYVSPIINKPDKIISLQEGSLVKYKGKPAVYYIKGNSKLAIPTEGHFLAFGFRWGNVREIDSSILDSYTSSKAIFTGGTLIQSNNSQVVYYVTTNGKRKWIHSADTFNMCGFKWSDIVKLPEIDVKLYEQEIGFLSYPTCK